MRRARSAGWSLIDSTLPLSSSPAPLERNTTSAVAGSTESSRSSLKSFSHQGNQRRPSSDVINLFVMAVLTVPGSMEKTGMPCFRTSAATTYHRSLARVVGRHIGDRKSPGVAGNIDDAALPSGRHARQDSMAAQERATDIRSPDRTTSPRHQPAMLVQPDHLLQRC